MTEDKFVRISICSIKPRLNNIRPHWQKPRFLCCVILGCIQTGPTNNSTKQQEHIREKRKPLRGRLFLYFPLITLNRMTMWGFRRVTGFHNCNYEQESNSSLCGSPFCAQNWHTWNARGGINARAGPHYFATTLSLKYSYRPV